MQHNTRICPYNLPLPPIQSLTMRFVGLEGLSKGEKMSVRVWGNPAPFAVGLSQINWEIIEMGGTYRTVRVMSCDVMSCHVM